MKKVIITGATGMIGATLAKDLIENGIFVLAIVRENSKRIRNLPKNNRLKIIECNLKDLKNLKINEKDFDVFYHFAWDGTFGQDRDNSEKQNFNVEYTLDALKLAVQAGCKKFVGAGSQAEYGRYDGIIDEETSTNPETEYGKAKLKAKIESQKLARRLKIQHIWTRIFSVYGPYDGENTMVMTSIREMLNGVSPEYTKGEQNWNYLFSEDLAKVLYYLGEFGKDQSVYCLASSETKKLSEYISIIKNVVNPELTIKFGEKPYSKKQVMNLNVNINKLITEFKDFEETKFEIGIMKTMEWYKNEKN